MWLSSKVQHIMTGKSRQQEADGHIVSVTRSRERGGAGPSYKT